jgi:two-component system NtrC family sensor kinase
VTWPLVAAIAVVALGFGWWIGAARGASTRAELRAAQAELSRRLNEVFALQELSFVLSESLQPQRIADQVTSYLSRFSDTQGALVALAADGGRGVRIAAASGTLAALRGREVADDDPGLLARALGQEQLVLGEPGPNGRPVVAAEVTAGRVAVLPLRAHGVTVGALGAVDPLGGSFDPAALRLLSTVATHAAIVLSNARFFDLVRAGRDQWETTFNAMAGGLAVVDQTGRVRRANRALATLVRTSIPALTGRPLVDTLVGSSPELAELLAAALRGETTSPLTQPSSKLDRLLRLTAAPMRGEGGAPWAVVLIDDVTEQAQLEAQLIQSEKMAAVGQLVSGVAHELNNPLTSIAGLAEFLLEQPVPSERDHEHLRVVRDQADRAGRIVRNLLTFARKGPADVGELDLNDIVQRTAMLVGYEVKLRDIKLETTLDPGVPVVLGDRYQIQQVVVNLVTNAIQAVQANPPDRARRIGLVTAVEDGEVLLRVSDSGAGIPEDVVGQIFTPFFTTKAPGQGTGLGLSISYRILEGHGGSLGVQRAVEGGAVFVMRLPIRSPVTPPRPSVARAAVVTEEHEVVAPAPRYDILLVDEDPAVRRMISVLLSGPTNLVATASDAAQAVAHLEERAFDVVIADARVPVSAGERFADHLLRRWPDLKDRAIFLTADVRPETEAWLKGLGCPYFLKPFRVGDLKAATAKILRRRRLVDQ